MSTLSKLEIFSPDEKENAGLAALSRGFLTTYGGKRAAFDRAVSKLLVRKLQVQVEHFGKVEQ